MSRDSALQYPAPTQRRLLSLDGESLEPASPSTQAQRCDGRDQVEGVERSMEGLYISMSAGSKQQGQANYKRQTIRRRPGRGLACLVRTWAREGKARQGILITFNSATQHISKPTDVNLPSCSMHQGMQASSPLSVEIFIYTPALVKNWAKPSSCCDLMNKAIPSSTD